MAFPQGIYFRAADDQVDPTNYDAEVGTTANYPRTTAQGNTVGWEAAPGGTRDRITTGDVRLRGIHFGAQTGSQQYRIDLPSAGNYNIRTAFGDASSPHAARIRFVDSTTVLIDHASASVNAAEFRDATGVIRTSEVDWVSNNAVYAATFASTIFRLDPTGGSTAVDPNWAVAALYVESAGGSTNTAVNPGVGTIALTGYAPSVAQSANQSVTPNAGSITITGYAPSIAQPHAVAPGAGSLTITGYAPSVVQASASQSILPGAGSLAITGYAPSVTQSSPSTKVGGDDVPTRGKRERIEIWDFRKKQPDPVEIEIEEVAEPIAEIEPQPIIRQPLTAEERAQAQKLASALIYKPVQLQTVPGIIAHKIQLAPYFASLDEDEEEALLMLL